ncbi:Exportin-6 [Gryganskiella cystojenkinii]|nr:Exportin-6 [Gryganskiella cystojenkinii]
MLSNGASDLLAWYAASQFQKRIHTEWSGLDLAAQQSNRSFLFQFLNQHFGVVAPEQGRWTSLGLVEEEHSAAGTRNGSSSTSSRTAPNESTTTATKTFPPFVLNKVIQLLTDIALLDWPDQFPDLLPEIHTLIQSKNKNHALLGWTLLEAFVQELIATYPAPGGGGGGSGTSTSRLRFVLSQRQRYLWEHFKGQVPELMNLMVQHLDTSYNRTLVAPLATEAPAPSPVENGLWGGIGGTVNGGGAMNHNFGRRSSAAAQPLSPLMPSNNSFFGSRAVPGSINNSFGNFNLPGSTLSTSGGLSFLGNVNNGQSHDHGSAYSFGKSPTTALRKTLSHFLGGQNSSGSMTMTDDDAAMPPPSPAQHGSGMNMLYARQRMGSISELGQMAMRRSSINAAAAMQSRRGSVDSTFVSGSRMDSHTRKTCLLALKSLTALLSCPALDARQTSFSSAISTVLKFSTLHQNKTVDMGILALSCLNGLVARPGFLATNQEAMAGAIKIMSSLIRYFNEVKDGIDDIDEGYLQMFMHFVSIFCTLPHLERAERDQGLPTADFLHSFAKFTLEKVSVDYLKSCMDIWKGLLDAMIYTASELPRPIPAEHPLRRLQGPLLYFLSTLVNNFYDMKGATQSEEAFSTFEVEDEEDLEALTELVESFAGLMGEVFMDEVIEMLISLEYYGTIGGASSPGKDEADLTGSITLALLHSLMPLIPWLEQLRQAEKTESTTTVRIPVMNESGNLSFWELEPTQGLVNCLHQNAMLNGNFMGTEFPVSKVGGVLQEEEQAQDREGITPTDELFQLAFTAVTYGLVLGIDDDVDGPVVIQALVQFVTPIVQPFRNMLQDPRASQPNFWSSIEVRATVHRTLAIFRALISSVSEATDSSRRMVFEASSAIIHFAEEYFKIFRDDQEIYMDILRFYRAEIKSLHRYASATHGLLIARFLIDQLSSSSPSLLDTALLGPSPTIPPEQQGLQQRLSFAEHQRRILERIQASVEIIRAVLEISKKEVTAALPDLVQFLLFQLGPKLMGTRAVIGSPSVQQQQASQDRLDTWGTENGVLELMTLYLSTIKTLVLNHSRYFFSHSLNARGRGLPVSSSPSLCSNPETTAAQQALQGCLETLAQGVLRPEPDVVRQSIEILREMHQSHLCRLFDRAEFQSRFQFEFLQILFRIGLSHGQDLLLEEIADLVHLMVKDSASSLVAARRLSGPAIHHGQQANGGAGALDASSALPAGSFLNVWHGDLKRIVAELQISQVLSAADSETSIGASNGDSPSAQMTHDGVNCSVYVGLVLPDSVKEALWMGLSRLSDESTSREGLYDFVSDARVYAQGLVADATARQKR